MLKEKFVSNTGTHKDLKRHKGRSGPNFYSSIGRVCFANSIRFLHQGLKM